MACREYGGVLATVGDTPLVRLDRLGSRSSGRLLAKLERFNPGGSVKDRPALLMLRDKVRAGELAPGRSTVVESSSGNLAIGLAQACRYFGLRFVCVVDAKTPAQVVAILRAYQVTVEVIAEPAPESGEFLPARLRRVREIVADTPGAYWPNQYANPLNPQAHEATMGEICRALDDRVDFLFAAASTTGTLLGCSRYARQRGLATTIVAVDAVGSVLFTAEPARYRLIPGYGASVRPELLDPAAADKVVHVTDLECVLACRRLMRDEAILAGGSSGATVAAWQKLAPSMPEGATSVLIFPDGGDRYLDTIFSDEWVTRHFGDVSHQWEAPGS